MFEVAAAYAYSLRHKMEYNVPIDGQNYVRFFPNIKTGLQLPQDHIQYKEQTHGFVAIPYYENVKIAEYFQSELYFKDYRNEVLELFGLPYQLNKGVVSIHVRRGDYVTYHTHFPPVDYRYLEPAVKFFKERGFKKFLVFGDDPHWNRQHINPENYFGCEFEYSAGRTEYEDLVLMSQCEHNIIANSTFSWWAAWLNRNPKKIVVSPSWKNWFGKNVKLDTKDIIPKSWYQIQF